MTPCSSTARSCPAPVSTYNIFPGLTGSDQTTSHIVTSYIFGCTSQSFTPGDIILISLKLFMLPSGNSGNFECAQILHFAVLSNLFAASDHCSPTDQELHIHSDTMTLMHLHASRSSCPVNVPFQQPLSESFLDLFWNTCRFQSRIIGSPFKYPLKQLY